MAGRPKKQISSEEITALFSDLSLLKESYFLRKKEAECLDMLSTNDFKNLNEAQLELIKKTGYLVSRTIKNLDLLAEIQDKTSQNSTEKTIIELSQKMEIDSFFSMLDLLDAQRKKIDVKFAENKIKQRIATMGKEKSPKKINDSKKFYLGSLLLSILEKRNPQLTDDMVMDSLIEMTENEKFGCELNEYLKANQNDANQRLRSFRDDSFSKTIEIKNIILQAKNDSRNPFNKK